MLNNQFRLKNFGFKFQNLIDENLEFFFIFLSKIATL